MAAATGPLPSDLWALILQYTGARQAVCCLGMTSRGMRRLATEDSVWQPIFRAQFPSPYARLTEAQRGDYFDLYVRRQSQLTDIASAMGLQPGGRTGRPVKPRLTTEVRRLQRAGPKPRLIFLGLDAAGKTTLLHHYKAGEVVRSIPTIGMNIENIETPLCAWTCWDVGGRDKLRPLWRHFFRDCQAVVFVVDSADRERIDQVEHELHHLLEGGYSWEDSPHGGIKTLLILANKQDQPGAMAPEMLVDRLGLRRMTCPTLKWKVFPTVATTGRGVDRAFQWLATCVAEQLWRQHGTYTSHPPGALGSVREWVSNKLAWFQ